MPRGARPEFAPDHDAPDGGDKSRALAERISNGWADDPRSDDVGAKGHHPDDPAQQTERMQPRGPSEVVAELQASHAHERRVQDKAAGEQAAPNSARAA